MPAGTEEIPEKQCINVPVGNRTRGMTVQVRSLEPTCSMVKCFIKVAGYALGFHLDVFRIRHEASWTVRRACCARSYRLIHTWPGKAGNHVTATRSEGDRDHFMSCQLTEAFSDDVMSLAVSSLLCYSTLIVDNRIVRKSWKDDWLFAVLLYLVTALPYKRPPPPPVKYFHSRNV